jgi:hypothetical protein
MHGFSIQFSAPRVPRDSEKVQLFILQISRQGSRSIHSTPRISPIRPFPYKAPGEYKMIHHLSYPSGVSINDFIDPTLCTVQYTSFDEAVKLVQALGPNCKLF